MAPRGAICTSSCQNRVLTGVYKRIYTVANKRHINIVTGLLPLVHARFADDLAHATSAIESAQATIVRWEGYRAEAHA